MNVQSQATERRAITGVLGAPRTCQDDNGAQPDRHERGLATLLRSAHVPGLSVLRDARRSVLTRWRSTAAGLPSLASMSGGYASRGSVFRHTLVLQNSLPSKLTQQQIALIAGRVPDCYIDRT